MSSVDNGFPDRISPMEIWLAENALRLGIGGCVAVWAVVAALIIIL